MPEIEKIIDAYKNGPRQRAAAERRFFVNQPSLKDVLRVAAYAIGPDRKRLSHQRRIKAISLKDAHTALVRNVANIQAAANFSQLHELIERLAQRISGLGELWAYDTSHRIGAFRKLEPQQVYLHAGVRVGLRHLMPGYRGKMIEIDKLPEPLRALKVREVENLLCVFANQLGGAPLESEVASTCGTKKRKLPRC